jgi:hypothetical protein
VLIFSEIRATSACRTKAGNVVVQSAEIRFSTKKLLTRSFLPANDKKQGKREAFRKSYPHGYSTFPQFRPIDPP